MGLIATMIVIITLNNEKVSRHKNFKQP
jgi:hypothetical protein